MVPRRKRNPEAKEKEVIDLTKWRVPAGSLMVDGALVASLAWSMATMSEKMAHFDMRMGQLEQAGISIQTEPRLRVLERRADEMAEFKAEVRDQLNRIEDKLDQALK
jgi:hypothetical protein